MDNRLMTLAGLSPLKQDDNKEEVRTYELMDFDDLIIRQQFNESRFKSDAVSPAGAISIAQITKQTFNEGIKNGYVPKDTKFEDLAKDDALAEKFQRAYIKDLMTRSWNKGSDVVKQAKALAAYNMGPTRLVNILNEMKADGIDIYSDDMLWVAKLPEYHKHLKGTKKGESIIESMNYVENIMLGGDEIYENNYKRLYDERFPEEEVIEEEKELSFFEKMMEAMKDVKAKQQKTEGSLMKLKDPYTGEKMFESPIKNITVNPISGLSPFKQAEEESFLDKLPSYTDMFDVKALIRKQLAKNLYPVGYTGRYGSGVGFGERFFNALFGSEDEKDYANSNTSYNDIDSYYKRTGLDPSRDLDFIAEKERMDLLQMVMGQEQKYNTIQPSRYKPTVGHEKGDKYYRSKATEISIRKSLESNYVESEYDTLGMTNIYRELQKQKPNKKGIKSISKRLEFLGEYNSLGNTTFSLGEDEKGKYISYYDVWDLDPTLEKTDSGIFVNYLGSTDNNALDKIISSIIDGASISNILDLTPPKIYGRVYLKEVLSEDQIKELTK
jgi:hypothetical protein|tara:strand:- start:522 stop:2183 length:1662 start_codon:yes stop_codon:yes gene_type:complete